MIYKLYKRKMPYMNLIFILTNLQRSINEATIDAPLSEMLTQPV